MTNVTTNTGNQLIRYHRNHHFSKVSMKPEHFSWRRQLLVVSRSTKALSPPCHLCAVTFAKSWTKLDMSPKSVCPFCTKTAENNWKFLCTEKGLANISDLAPKSPIDQKLDMSLFCSKQSICDPKLITSRDQRDIYAKNSLIGCLQI